jgi:hypothetical protein
MIRSRTQAGHVEVEVEEAGKDAALVFDGICEIAHAQVELLREVSLIVGQVLANVL